MQTVLTILATGAVCIASFLIGARHRAVQQATPHAEKPSIDPLRAVRHKDERKKAKASMERYDAILHNIDAYDGTSKGQKDIPGGG